MLVLLFQLLVAINCFSEINVKASALKSMKFPKNGEVWTVINYTKRHVFLHFCEQCELTNTDVFLSVFMRKRSSVNMYWIFTKTVKFESGTVWAYINNENVGIFHFWTKHFCEKTPVKVWLFRKKLSAFLHFRYLLKWYSWPLFTRKKLKQCCMEERN